MAHLTPVQQLAAGMRPPPSLASHFAAVQAAWRFLANERTRPVQLAEPLLECARQDVGPACDAFVLVALDWSPLHFSRHRSKLDKVVLQNRKDLGYELLTALAISDRSGAPLAPLCLELRAADGTHSSRAHGVMSTNSPLDALCPVMDHVAACGLDKRPLFVIDRGADSVGHFRHWDQAGHVFLVRANDARLVLHRGASAKLGEVADQLGREGALARGGEVTVKGGVARQYVGETEVTLHRPARSHRVDKLGQKRHKNIAGPPLVLRLVVSELRRGSAVVARWLMLTNLPGAAHGEQIALWYYWRWRIESYHKLLKGAGQQLEQWQQETAQAVLKRLLIAGMSTLIVWRLAREPSEEAQQMRELLVRLSGRQMRRGRGQRTFTEPALLAGLGVLLPILNLLQTYDLAKLQKIAQLTLPQTLV